MKNYHHLPLHVVVHELSNGLNLAICLNKKYATVQMNSTENVHNTRLKPGFYSNARNARKVLRKKKYASKIKSAQETQ